MEDSQVESEGPGYSGGYEGSNDNDGGSGWGHASSGPTSLDRGDNTPATPGGPRPDAGNPSHYGGEYGGQAAPGAMAQYMTRQWNLFMNKMSQPKTIGKVAGLIIGGPIYGPIAAPFTGWLADKISTMKTPDFSGLVNRPSFAQQSSFTSSGNNMFDPNKDFATDSDGGGYQQTFLDQQKLRVQGLQQQAWMSYLQGLDPKKKATETDNPYEGLLT